MYYKAKVFGDMETAHKILNVNDAKIMKNLGRSVRNFDDNKWKQISILVFFLKFIIYKNYN